jgi:diketogulonate reductase-like aldo/keto reductase
MEQVVAIDQSAKRIGLSNVSEYELLDIIAFVRGRRESGESSLARMPDVVQAYADPTSPSVKLREICTNYGIEFVSYSTLGTQHTMRTRGGANPVLGNSLIMQLADEYRRSTAEVVLSWAMQRNMSVIPRSSNQEHIIQLSNLIYNEPFLENYQLNMIDNLSFYNG